MQALVRARTALVVALALFAAAPAHAKSAAELERTSRTALDHLLASNQAARALAKDAEGILVFPNIVKGGFIFGGQFGDGTLFVGGAPDGYFRTLAASYGLQAGAQSYGYALFFMNRGALDYFRKSHGWEIGVGPSLVVVDKGVAGSLTTTTARSDVYAFFFDQQGLMGGIGLQGTKITQIHPK